jgi:purine-binding chemotaxis protein CheW
MSATSESVRAGASGDQYVTFCVAGEYFAVPMAPVQEIIRVPQVARLPLAPPALEGLANLRGRVLPIVDLRRMFGLDPRAHDDSTRALVIDLGQPLGFVVDRVASVLSAEADEVESAASIESLVRADYVSGVIRRRLGGADEPERLLMVLDFERLVREHFAQLQMQRAAAGGLGAAAAGRYGAAESAAATAEDELRLVSFSVGGQEYAVDISVVQEIVQLPDTVTAVPNSAPHVLGLISLRRRLLPLLSLRELFGLGAAPPGAQQRIVVVADPSGAQVGLVTDFVREVLSVPKSHATEVPAVLSRERKLHEFESICRLDDGRRLLSVISTARLLGSQAMLDAAAAVASAVDGGETEMDENDAVGAKAEDDVQVVIFRLDAEEYGVPITAVQEIVRVPDVLTRVPKAPAFVQGVINLRGSVLPVVDQRRRLGLASVERNDRQRIMVYSFHGSRTGFIVDSVAEVLRIPLAQIERAPHLSEEQSSLISRVAKLDGDRRLVLLIEPDQLLGSIERDAIGAALADGADAVRAA